MNAIESIEYRGFNINIYHDDDPISPIDDWDMAGTMVCWHNRYTLGHEQPKCESDEWFQQLAIEADPTLEDRIDYWENGIGWRKLSIKYSNFNDNKAFDACEERVKALIEKTIRKYYVILPLYLYDHSGITISTGPFSCPWDSGQIGYIYISIENILKEFNRKKMSKKLRQKAINLLRGEVNAYDDYLTGNVYGYTIEPTDKNKSIECDDSCWGFYGDYENSGLLESAKGSIDYAIEKYKENCKAEHERRKQVNQFMQSSWAY
jgi:hypothetical protein